MIVHLEYPGLGTLPIPGLPIKLSLTPASIDSPAPRLGEQNEEVYGNLLGFSRRNLRGSERRRYLILLRCWLIALIRLKREGYSATMDIMSLKEHGRELLKQDMTGGDKP